jgi:RTX calcium-binding nonapeptide repeat (4 copies)
MRAGRVVPVVCAALFVVCASAGADEVAPSAGVAPVAEPVVPSAATMPAATPAAQVIAAPTVTAVAEASAVGQSAPAATPIAAPAPEAGPAPTPIEAGASEAAPAPTQIAAGAPEAAPAPIPTAARAARATPAPVAIAATAGAAAAAAQPTPVPTPSPGAAQPPAPGPTAPGDCATTVEFPDGSIGCEEDCASTGEFYNADGTLTLGCDAASAACSILGTDADDVLTGSPFDDVLCGFGGHDHLHGGDGSDVLVGGDGDDILVGGDGDDCIQGGPGTNSADAPPEDRLVEFAQTPYERHQGFWVDAEGRCVELLSVAPAVVVPRGSPPPLVGVPPGPGGRSPGAQATVTTAPGGAGIAASAAVGGLRLAVSGGARVVRRGVVRVRMSCSASVSAELVLLAGSRRIAHERFVCRPPGSTVRVRLNEAGRRLVARNGRVRARVLVLAAGRTVAGRVLLVDRGG